MTGTIPKNLSFLKDKYTNELEIKSISDVFITKDDSKRPNEPMIAIEICDPKNKSFSRKEFVYINDLPDDIKDKLSSLKVGDFLYQKTSLHF